MMETQEKDPIEILEEKLEVLKKRLDGAAKALASADFKYESDDLAELGTAIAKAQGEMMVAKPKSTNPFFKSKYADLSDVVKASREALSKNGLAVVQRVVQNGSPNPYLQTRLIHSSGQWMESRMTIDPPKKDIQSIGSCITYLRRYAYAAMVGVVASEEDDDGESVMHTVRKEDPEHKKKQTITATQLDMLSSELTDIPEYVDQILKAAKIEKLANLPRASYTHCMDRIREVKRAREM